MSSRRSTHPIIPAFLLWIIGLVVLFLVVDRLVMPWAAGRFLPTVEVPSITGMTPAAAEATLKAAGLGFAADSEGSHHRAVPEGHVLTQVPAAGARVKQGRRVWGILSLGPEPVIHPGRGR